MSQDAAPAAAQTPDANADKPRRHHVVIIGSGFGGLAAARRLNRADVEITMIARTSHHLFQPLLYQVATGLISQGQIAPQVRVVLAKQQNVQVILGDVDTIDLTSRTVTSRTMGRITEVTYDSLIVAAGAGQSYFGNDHFAEFAPGLKTIDDALELRGRILGAFEQAELSDDPEERERLLTFVVIGAGPTGVEMAGQIVELADKTLAGAFRNIDPTESRVILLDAASAVLPPFGPKLGARAEKRLRSLGVDVQLGAMVVDMDYHGLMVKDADGSVRRIEAQCKVWSAGVAASPLGRQLAEQSGVELDRAGRVKVQPDLSIPGHAEVFVVGDMMAIDGVPGLAPAANQSARYAADTVLARIKGNYSKRPPFEYWDKGSMATVARFAAVAKIPVPGTDKHIEFAGFFAWVGWLFLHLLYLVGFRNRFTTFIDWTFAFTSRARNQMAVTEQQVFARNVIEKLSEVRDDEDDELGAA
ncbi:NAD(P)/FAD-dependent oxidoreductase [Gordonia desulfuricans]|uniref:NADH:ubiquinone reductase (non-electrogenic) n=1 Tax=Gordonia desulfuricans TaxID=89051 RepID=A0A7K3LK61_9ACTN|nr:MULTISPECIES: NAD(P)/FAD-dependent oxidoreductase [Gordonia]KOY49767.1 NADH dehydrogenase [Gordonia sp. NB41Y]NDK88626.1 NAD(P)/FAD-dependent oxidoreductase [Gordonia desulfuricans]WLP91952.1 NAD(P)/FAD-dependent oxidoreductase [Gordonia sp. NB41Y]